MSTTAAAPANRGVLLRPPSFAISVRAQHAECWAYVMHKCMLTVKMAEMGLHQADARPLWLFV